MVIEFVIDKLEAHWSRIEVELGPRRWADFTRRYRAISALDARNTETFIRQLRELMTSMPYTARLWEQWREEADFACIGVSIEVWKRIARGREQRLEQLAKRYRALGASGAATPPTPQMSESNAGRADEAILKT